MTISDGRNENKMVMQKIVDIFMTRDLTQVDAVIASEYVDHQGLNGIVIRGQDGFRHVVTAARTGLPNLKIIIHDLIAEEDKVVARLQWWSVDQAGNIID